MNKAEILITVLSLFFCTFVPFVISFLLIRNYNRTSGVKRKTSDVVMYAVCVLCELSILEATLRVLKSNGLIDFVKRLIKFDIYYKDISVLAVAVGVSCVASVFITVISEMIRRRSISTSMPSKRSLASVLALLSAVCIPVLLGLYFEDNQYKNLEITGICRETSEEERSERIKEVVWGEYLITNNSALRIEVNDLWLSTDNEDLCKLSVTGILIEAGETYTVTAAEDDRLDISKDGGSEVILSDNDGKIISKVTVPALKNREWYEKKNGEWQTVQKGRVVDKKVSTPQFSAVGGFYDDAFDLSITAEEGLTIHYTLDGSIPTTESAIYESPLYIYNRSAEPNVYKAIKNVTLDYLVNDYTPTYPVDKATVVRAVAIDGEGNISPIVTQTYFVGLDKYKYQDVVSLVSDPKGLFSEETGIYANGKNTDEYLDSLSEEEMKEAIKDWYAFVLATPPNWEQRGSEWDGAPNLNCFQTENHD